MNLTTTTIGIVGMGQTGCSVLRWLLAQGQQPVLFDSRENLPPTATELLAKENSELRVHLGQFSATALKQCQVLVVSPGIAVSTPAIAEAQAAGVEVIGDVELFCRFDQRPRIAITGSNGKSTVTTLVAEMLNAAGLKAIAAGNIGLPVLDIIDSDDDVVVLELSSFQLETTDSLNAKVGCYLNASADHLDRYASFDDYAAVKSKIFQNADVAVWNRQDDKTKPPANIDQQISFGLNALATTKQWHICAETGETAICFDGQPKLQRDDMAMLGAHNQANAMAALACVSVLIEDLAPCIRLLKDFRGLPHRCETVLQQRGVVWVNDSKATNEGATLAALGGLAGSYQGKLILLAGGDGKGTDFCTLKAALNERVDELICYGKDAVKLASKRHQARLVNSLEEAVKLANDISCHGDLVLLSPACASLDQFPNYMVRGERFADLAREVSQ